MTQKRWDGSSYIDITTAKRWDGTSWVNLTIGKRWDGTSWTNVLTGGGGNLSATAAPGSAVGAVTDNNLFTVVTSNSVAVTATGGTGPYTYKWSRVSGDSAPLPSNSTASSVTFSATVGRDQERNATWKCVVTDAVAATAEVVVSVTLIHNSTL